MIKKIAKIQLILAILVVISAYLVWGTNAALSASAAIVISLANLGLLYVVWKFIFNKKLIALTSVIIIFKYLILGGILVLISRQSWIDPIGFILGMSTLLIAITLSIVLKYK